MIEHRLKMAEGANKRLATTVFFNLKLNVLCLFPQNIQKRILWTMVVQLVDHSTKQIMIKINLVKISAHKCAMFSCS
jgi:hypothetical protein